jgi:D-lactate dehydrogenase
MSAHPRDLERLPAAYRQLHDELVPLLGAGRVVADPLRTLAYGTDASFYRLVPKLVAKVATVDELVAVLGAAARLALPVTFRAGGTSLSGQAITDSVLVVCAGAWRGARVLDGGARIALEPGVIGGEANALLAPLGRKIGPDPASINAAMIGGIAANNAAGMCCGTAQNTYRTAESMKIVLWDGTLVDTADEESRRRLARTHGPLLAELAAIRDEIRADRPLADRIVEKYRIKNTTGYSLNAFVDYDDPVDILMHLMVGSEGTLGFIAEVTYSTVPDHPHKASALVFFPDIEQAARAVQAVQAGPVSAAELMDRASLRSVEARDGMPACLATLGPDACAILVETRAPDAAALREQIAEIERLLAPVPALFPVAFTDRKAEYERLWEVRKGLLPTVGGTRPVGTTVIIEDVVFPMRHLAEGTVEVQRLMRAHGYDDAIIFGHALDGNLHLTFAQGFGSAGETARYGRLMEELCELVVKRYDGALKGEHGTGRNMAPFVELEWGATAYALMKRLKAAFDPRRLLNPGVILNDDPRAHLEDLKPLPPAHALVDRCMECGFCEPRCCARELTLSPRQRIVVRREISRLEAGGGDPERLARLEADFAYDGDATCAADGLCATGCPMSIDSGEYVKALRAAARPAAMQARAQRAAEHLSGLAIGVRAGLGAAAAGHAVLGTALMRAVGKAASAVTAGAVPPWTPHLPLPQRKVRPPRAVEGADRSVVYYPSCVARTMGPARGAPDDRGVQEATLSLLAKAGYHVVLPAELDRLCCGMAFESKGFPRTAAEKAGELSDALLAASGSGSMPVLCDTSPCLHRMRKTLDPRLKLYEPIEFIRSFLADRLVFERRDETVAIHPPCSTQKMGLTEAMRALAQACVTSVVLPAGVNCCGFAGDKGFHVPELNASALARLAPQLPADCRRGFSNSRTCEIGLSEHAGIPYQSIVHLVDQCTRARPAPPPTVI